MAFVTPRQGAFFTRLLGFETVKKKRKGRKDLGQKKLAGVGEMVTGF